jgi:hypothetical protein
MSCKEIAKMHPAMGTHAQGLVVRARIENDWDTQKEEYIRNLHNGAREAVEKVSLESIRLSASAMAAFHLLTEQKFNKFLSTGDPESLGDWKDFSFQKYRQFMEIIQSWMGENGSSKKGSTLVRITEDTPKQLPNEQVVEALPAVPQDKPLTPQDASALLDAMLKGAAK